MAKMKKENVWNVPNTLMLTRVLLAFVIIFYIFSGGSMGLIVILFVIGMITDMLDGQIARRFDQKTEFGRQFDMTADRFFMTSVVVALVVSFLLDGTLTKEFILQLLLIMSREIISIPFAIVMISSGKSLPEARLIGKTVTVMQGFAFPILLLSIDYAFFALSIYLSAATGILGIASAVYYINDVLKTVKE